MTEFLGRTIGNYQLVESLLENGDSVTIKAFQPEKDRYVAFKTLKPDLSGNQIAVQRFIQMARLASEMRHPNLLLVEDFGQFEDVVFSVSPLIDGGPLRNSLALFNSPAPALSLLKQIVAGLEYLHIQGYVHGNLTSSNTYVDSNHRPLLSDYGVIQTSYHNQNPYRSPEQVQGAPVDLRTDVFSIGILLYELLVGEAPPSGVVTSLHSKRPDLPEAVERVYLKAIAQNPDQRYQSPAEFSDALQKALQQPIQANTGLPQTNITSMPTPAISQNAQISQPKGTNWLAIILGIVLIILCAVTAVLVIPRLMGGDQGTVVTAEPLPDQPTEPPVEPTPPVDPTVPAPEQLPIEQPDGDQPGNGLPGICGSVGMVFGFVFLFMFVPERHGKSYKKERYNYD